MSINKRIIEYLNFKGISQRTFSKKMNLSEGILRRGNNIGSVHFRKMRSIFTDLNINWVLFEDNEMLISNTDFTNEPNSKYNIKTKNELIYLQKEVISLQKELLEAKDSIIVLKNSLSQLEKK